MITIYWRRPANYVLLALICVLSFPVYSIQRDGVSASLGGFYSTIDSGVASTLVGDYGDKQGSASFESDLHLEETSIQPILNVQWNFKQKHSLSLNYFGLDRKSTITNVGEFTIGEHDYKAGTLLDTKLDLQLWQIKYGYSFYLNEASEWGVTGGLHLINFDIAFNGTVATDIGNGLLKDVDANTGFNNTVPLPNIGTYYNYNFTEDFRARLNAQYFDISVDILDARMVSFEVGVEYYPVPNISLYTGLSYYDVKATYTQDVRYNLDIDWDVKLEYWGPSLAIGYQF